MNPLIFLLPFPILKRCRGLYSLKTAPETTSTNSGIVAFRIFSSCCNVRPLSAACCFRLVTTSDFSWRKIWKDSGVQRTDAPRLQVFTAEMAMISFDYFASKSGGGSARRWRVSHARSSQGRKRPGQRAARHHRLIGEQPLARTSRPYQPPDQFCGAHPAGVRRWRSSRKCRTAFSISSSQL